MGQTAGFAAGSWIVNKLLAIQAGNLVLIWQRRVIRRTTQSVEFAGTSTRR